MLGVGGRGRGQAGVAYVSTGHDILYILMKSLLPKDLTKRTYPFENWLQSEQQC